MPIQDDTITFTSSPVLARSAIGQHFVGVMCAMREQRDRLKDGNPIRKPNGKHQQELVLTLLTMPGTTMPVGKIGEHRLPDEGEVVRAILKGKAFGDFIDADKAVGGKTGVGYIVEMTVDKAQTYDENGNATGHELTTQAECDAVPRGRSLGYYTTLTIREPVTALEVAWDTKACKHYNDTLRGTVATPEPESEPF